MGLLALPMAAMEGWLARHWEMGMEVVALSFQDSAHADNRTGGWRYEGTHPLQAGDHLTILDDDHEVVWRGQIGGHGALDVAPGATIWSPEGIDEAVWLGWFERVPAMNARLVR
jgi:hypothetical protein